MPGRDKTDLTLPQGIQEGDHGVATQPEDYFHAELFQVVRKKIGGNPVARLRLELFNFNKMRWCSHDSTASCSLRSSLWWNSPKSSESGGRSSGVGRLTHVTFI